MESPFEIVKGVIKVDSGYSGGDKVSPTYKQVAGGQTKHIEAVEVTYSADLITYEQLLKIFWRQIDPTQVNGQFVDIGPQYRSAIFYQNDKELSAAKKSIIELKKIPYFKNKKIATDLIKYKSFYIAEDYHQDYYKKSSIKYKYYRYRSGRDQFLKKVWGNSK